MAASAMADMAVVRYHVQPRPYSGIYDYYAKVLDLALSKTVARYGAYSLKPVEFAASNPRLNQLLEYGQDINVLVAQPNQERDERFVPVRIPLDKGLLGYRIMIIRSADAALFSAVRSVEDLRRLHLGQGFDWEDTHVLAAAGLPVEVASDRSTLMDMLGRGRFQGFPRGVYEIDEELENHASSDSPPLQAEAGLMLHYKATKIFYVSKADAPLAERLEAGLRMAIADGSFDRLFYSHPTIAGALQRANFAGRRVFELPNPRIPATFPVDDPELWYVPPEMGGGLARRERPRRG
ncbi:MAG: hypothetical protein ACM3Q1_17550 [Bacteroidales bacterium]